MSDTNPVWEFYSKVVGENKVAICHKCIKNFSYRTSITNLKCHLRLKHPELFKKLIARSTQKRRSSPVKSEPQDVNSPKEITDQNYSDMDDSSDQHVELENSNSDLLTEYIHVENSNISAHPKRIIQLEFISTPEHEDSKSQSEKKNNNLPTSRSRKVPSSEEKNNAINAMLLKLIVKMHQPFSMVEEDDFVAFVQALNPNYTLPDSIEITNNLIPTVYSKCLDNLKSMLDQEASTISLTIERWTSVTMETFLCITAHYINDNFEFKSVTLKCSLAVSDSSQYLAAILKKTCTEWGILDKINSCVTDDSSNMTEAVDIMKWARCSCIASKLKQILQHTLTQFDKTLNKMRKIVIYYNSTSKAKEMLLKYQKENNNSSRPLVLINAVPTRWSSTYLMIERFVFLQEAIKATSAQINNDLPKITEEEWIVLRQLCKVLKPFEEATKELSKEKFVPASKAIAVVNGLRDVMGELKSKLNYFDGITNIVESIEVNLDSKFKDLEHDASLALCIILDPRYKMSMFTNEAAAETAKSNLLSKVVDLMIEEAGPESLPTEEPQSSWMEPDTNISLWRKRNLILEKRRSNPQQNLSHIALHQVESYIQDEYGHNDCDPCDWWLSTQLKYPHLAKIFTSNCNMVASSIPSHILFTEEGQTLLDMRARLPVKQTQQLVFLNSNSDYCDYQKLIRNT